MSKPQDDDMTVKVQTETASASSEKRWYDANCHCRAVQWRLKLPPLYPEPTGKQADNVTPTEPNPYNVQDHAETEANRHGVTDCNCSICTKNGCLSVYPDQYTELEFIKGRESLSRYQFGSKCATHRFCPVCGSSVMVEIFMGGMEKVAMNARMIKGIDVGKLNLVHFNGWKMLGPPYDD